jgi:UPF0755 protein
MPAISRQKLMGLAVLVLLVTFAGLFLYDLQPPEKTQAGTAAPMIVFQIQQGQGFRLIANDLYNAGLIRSPIAFEFYALLDGKAMTLKPGLYRLSASSTTPEILAAIGGVNAGESAVTIPEGSNIYEIDKILSDALVIHPGDLIALQTASNTLEGRLFPDTYNFYTNASAADIVKELTQTFNEKVAPLLATDNGNFERNLIVASLVEKEVPDPGDQAIVAGIILKRLAAKMPLDIDATICYAKTKKAGISGQSCYPLAALDFKIDSAYNTYLYKGLPPAPIGNPGVSAVNAALHPESSPYWYYLSDPATGKTIFAKTLDEQNQNKVKYLVR